MSDHTKPPWNIYEFRESHSGRHTAFVADSQGTRVCNLPYTDATAYRQKANAAFIVRAANCHDDILRELRHLVRLLESLEWSYVDDARNDRCPTCEGYRWQGHVDGCDLAARLNGARAAIARATAPGGTE